MTWLSLFLFSAIGIVRSCEGYNVKSIMNDAKNREAMIGEVLESYVKPFKKLSANFPRHDVEIQLEFQRPTHQQVSKLIKKRPVYRESFKRPKLHALHERGHSGVDYLAERNANEHYLVPGRKNVEYLPFNNVAGHNTMDHFVSRGVIDNYGGRKIIDHFHNGIDSFGNHNGMVNFGSRNDMSILAGLYAIGCFTRRSIVDIFGGCNDIDNFGKLAGHNTLEDLSSRNTLGKLNNNAGYSANNNLGHNAMDSFAGHNGMNMNHPGLYHMNHGVGNDKGQETAQVAPKAPTVGTGAPPVARQAETEVTTTEAAVTVDNVNKGSSLSLEDIRRLFDEYAEKIISSKSGNEQQIPDTNQVPQVYIQDNNGQVDDSMLSNLDQIANLIKKGVQIHKVDEDNQEGFLPKTGLNWMRIKVPV